MSKGRNKNLIKKRNEALIRRYYYWTEVRRRRFDDVLKILSEEEFFLSEERIREAGNRHEKDSVPVPQSPHRRMPRITEKQLSLFR
ncbi:transposase [Parabacteroides goldsteinii]|uniref:transposase n=1 Tax=Parabacteroides goldsteinii TaxID=328812 RepID=UPI00256F0ADA|nr:transposase [Parabacteroides goldsteinii]